MTPFFFFGVLWYFIVFFIVALGNQCVWGPIHCMFKQTCIYPGAGCSLLCYDRIWQGINTCMGLLLLDETESYLRGFISYMHSYQP